MDKRDLEKLVKDADWKRLHKVIQRESDIHVRSTIRRLINIFADLRMDRYVIAEPKYRGLQFMQREVYILMLFTEGKYTESKCITGTHHLLRYIEDICSSLNEDEVKDAKSAIQEEGFWKRDNIELRIEHKHLLFD